MEKNLKKHVYNIYAHIHIYVKQNHFSVHLRLTKHCKSTYLKKKDYCKDFRGH